MHHFKWKFPENFWRGPLPPRIPFPSAPPPRFSPSPQLNRLHPPLWWYRPANIGFIHALKWMYNTTFHFSNQVRIHPFPTAQYTSNRNIYYTVLSKTETTVYIYRHEWMNEQNDNREGKSRDRPGLGRFWPVVLTPLLFTLRTGTAIAYNAIFTLFKDKLLRNWQFFEEGATSA